MTQKWRATMPKDKPLEGEALIVFSVINSKGSRAEFSGKVTKDCADKMMGLAVKNPVKLNLTPASN